MQAGISGWGLDEHGEAGSSTEQRRLRHVTDILIRNLSVSEAYDIPAKDRYSHLLAGPSTTNSAADLTTSRRPQLRSHASRDDIDLHLPPSLQRRNNARRKRAISSLSAGFGDVTERDSRTTDGYRSLSRANSTGSTGNNKGKGRAIEQNISAKGDPAANGEDNENEDTDLVFGWMSASTPSLTRSKSKGSIKSISSRRSSSSFGKRLFRQGSKHNSNVSDEDETESPPERSGGPTSPSAHHVSFQFSAEAPPTLPSSLGYRGQSSGSIGRDRSASRGSILSIASGSSGSTIRQIPAKFSEKEERKLRQRRQDNIRNHLVRSRLTLSLPAPRRNDTSTTAKPFKPSFPRSRTVSLPLSPSHGSFLGGHDTSASPIPRDTACRSKPFFVSPIHSKSMDPSFALDPADLLVPPDMQDILQREDGIAVGLWVEDLSEGKGAPGRSDDSWRLLLEWEIDLRGLVSLGTDPLLFPEALPPNTLIFKLSNTNEYYTARLPAFRSSKDRLDEEDEDCLSGISEVEDGRDGNLSDPGPEGAASLSRSKGKRAALVIGRDKREREKLLARKRLVIERSVRETKMLQSVDDEQLKRVVGKEREVLEKKKALKEIRRRTDEILDDEVFQADRQHGQLGYTVDTRRKDLEQLEAAVEALSRVKKDKVAALQARQQHLKEAKALLEKKREALIQSQAEHEIDKSVQNSVRLSFAQRRAYLVSELSGIFPIEPVDPASLLFSICGLALPNSNYDAKLPSTAASRGILDDDTISSALGYVAQVVNLLAAYLAVPLYYPLRCMGSRSLVQDPISQIKGPKIFPLYSKAVDKYRFDYAVFLLNKNIEQLMVKNGIVALDLRQTLPNLKNLYLTLSTDATSQSSSYGAKSPAASTRATSSTDTGASLFDAKPGSPTTPSRPVKQLTSTTPLKGRKQGLNGTATALEKILETSLVLENGTARGAKTQPSGKRGTTEVAAASRWA